MQTSRLDAIVRAIAALKRPADPARPPRIPVETDGRIVAFLRAVPAVPGSTDDARCMAEWRNLHKTAFFTWITATADDTRRWLAQTYAPQDTDIIFMLERPDGVPFGHVALYNFQADAPACEFGRILRGPGAPAGAMKQCCLAVLDWAATRLGIERFWLEVFADNERAIALYEWLGFAPGERLALKRIDAGGVTRWEKTLTPASGMPAADGYALRMELAAAALRTRTTATHEPKERQPR